MTQIRVKDFTYKAYPTYSRIAGREHEWKWKVVTADGKTEVERGFRTKRDAQEWVSRNVKIAKEMIKRGMWK